MLCCVLAPLLEKSCLIHGMYLIRACTRMLTGATSLLQGVSQQVMRT